MATRRKFPARVGEPILIPDARFYNFTGQLKGLRDTATATALQLSGNGPRYLTIQGSATQPKISTSAGAIEIGQLMQVTGGGTVPTAGAGVETAYTGGQGYVIAYDRSGAVYKPINIGGSTVALAIGGVTKLTVDASGHTIGAAEVRAGNSLQARGANATTAASMAVLDYSGGARLIGSGPDASNNPTMTILTVRSDGSNAITHISGSMAGALTFPQHVSGTATWVAGDKYLVVDGSGNLHVSAVGPAS